MEAMQALGAALRVLEQAVPPPKLVQLHGGPAIRYLEQLPQQAVVAKLARALAALHSARILVDQGMLQDAGAIQRVLDEQNEDVTYISLAMIAGEFTKDHEKFFREFWQEELENVGTPQMRNIPRARVPRESIRAYIANAPFNGFNQSRTIETGKTINKSFSGYVHGAGSHIMEMCGGMPSRFHPFGMRGTRLWLSQVQNMENYLHRTINAFAFGALAIGNRDLFDHLRELRGTVEASLGMDYFEKLSKKHQKKERRLSPKPGQPAT